MAPSAVPVISYVLEINAAVITLSQPMLVDIRQFRCQYPSTERHLALASPLRFANSLMTVLTVFYV
jgi:hypothetical protein